MDLINGNHKANVSTVNQFVGEKMEEFVTVGLSGAFRLPRAEN